MPETISTAPTKRKFESIDVDKLSEDDKKRYVYASKTVGHALATDTEKGTIIQQFFSPEKSNPETPTIEKLQDFVPFEQSNKRFLAAKTADGKQMIARRSLTIRTDLGTQDETEHELWLFSPRESYIYKGKYFIGTSKEPIPLFNDEHKMSNNLPPKIKEETWKIDKASVPIRDANKDRNPDQNEVMKKTAINEIKEYYDNNKDKIHPDRKAIFEKIEKSRNSMGSSPYCQPRPEWLHGKGWGLTPISDNPQLSSNLGSASKWCNTDMMTAEGVAKWHAFFRPDSEIEGSYRFTMIPDSDIIDTGHVHFDIAENGNKVRVSKDFNPWEKYPSFPKTTDVTQTTLITHRLLCNDPPIAEEIIDPKQPPSLEKINEILAPSHVDSVASSSSSRTKQANISPNTHQDFILPLAKRALESAKLDTGAASEQRAPKKAKITIELGF